MHGPSPFMQGDIQKCSERCLAGTEHYNNVTCRDVAVARLKAELKEARKQLRDISRLIKDIEKDFEKLEDWGD